MMDSPAPGKQHIRDPLASWPNPYDEFGPFGVEVDSGMSRIQDAFLQCMEEGIVDEALRRAHAILAAAGSRFLIDLRFFDPEIENDAQQVCEQIGQQESGVPEIPMSWES